MALKGHATIELTSADGSVEKIEHDNIITKAPSDLLKGYMGDVAPIVKWMANGDSFMQAIFGGIMLFSDSLDSDPDNYAIPNGKVVGYASQDAYAGANTARGSYNETESGVQDDGSYRFVWDFATSQANGTIKALALVPDKMGKIGLSASAVESENIPLSLTARSTPFDSSGGFLSTTDTIDGHSSSDIHPVAIIDNTVYALYRYNFDGNNSDNVKNNGGVLRFYRFSIAANDIGADAKIGRARYIDYIDVTLPSDFVSTLTAPYSANNPVLAWNFIPNTGKLAVFPLYMANIAPSGSMKYIEIDFKNGMSVSQFTFTNNTQGTVPYGFFSSTSSNFWGFALYLCVFEDYIIFTSYNNTLKTEKFYRASRIDNTDVIELKLADGNEFDFAINAGSASYNRQFQPVFFTKNTLVVNSCLNANRTLYYATLFFDLVNGIIQKTNAAQIYGQGTNTPSGNGVLTFGNGSYLKMFPIVNPFVLCTKNNLDTAVTKTASQTMKITYTLTESEGA